MTAFERLSPFSGLLFLLLLSFLSPTTALPLPKKIPPPTIPPQAPDDPITCASGLHIIIPRGIHQPGNGPTSSVELRDLPALAESIANSIPDSNVHEIRYPHWGVNYVKEYLVAIPDGAGIVRKHVRKYIETCGPDAKIAMLGYAWGAAIVSDLFVGSGRDERHAEEKFYQKGDDWKDDVKVWRPGPGRFAPETREHVVAAVVFSSPTAFARTGYSRGTAARDGMFAAARGPLSVDYDKFRSYCDDGDWMCSEEDNFTGNAHGRVVRKYMQDAKEFILRAWEKKDEGGEDLEGIGGGGEDSSGGGGEDGSGGGGEDGSDGGGEDGGAGGGGGEDNGSAGGGGGEDNSNDGDGGSDGQ